MQQQDKIDGTYGRNRRKTSIGLYDADLISFPLYYTTVLPEGIKFVPLDFKVEMTPAEILEDHPKGKVYAHLVENMRRYPIFKDMTGKVLSFPPIINSNDLGKLTDKSTNLLVEVTGTNYEAVNNVLRIMTLSLAARGGDIHEVKINYPYRRAERTPRYSTETWSLPVELVNRKLGLNLTGREIASLLEKARHGVKRVWAGKVVVAVPAYRTDILHVVDLVEDVAVMYGYSNFKPQELELATVGSLTAQTKFSNKVCDLMVGFGAQEVQTFTLTDPNIFANTNCSDKHVELENPMTQSYSVLRPRLWPMLVNFLSKNTNKEYPQRVFEVGDVVIPNVDAETKSDTVRRLAFAFAGTGANFTYAKQVMITLLASLGKECSCREIDDDSFVAGRACGIYSGRDRVGVIGEIGPTVLEKVGIEMPVCVFEVSLGALAGNN
jgi:phenylalanyl-tRNA synthetase beta chain